MKAIMLSLDCPGIKILFLRKSYWELQKNHIDELKNILYGIAKYNGSNKSFIFPNGSKIDFGYCDNEADINRYQGQEYDVIFIDEATQFTEKQFTILKACIRGTNNYPKRIYLTCNPGGVGHEWVKRLFIDRSFKKNEKPSDYLFIPARLEDNYALMQRDPDYIDRLREQDPSMAKAWLEGSWDLSGGIFFKDFDRSIHVYETGGQSPGFSGFIESYIAFDYGLDMFACYLVSVDEKRNIYVRREIHKSNLLIYEAAGYIHELMQNENVLSVFAPSDLWGREHETGKTRVQMFADNGIYLTKVSTRDKTAGWYLLKELLINKRIFINSSCINLIHSISTISADLSNPSDVSAKPHILTHSLDAIRYLIVSVNLDKEEKYYNEPVLW